MTSYMILKKRGDLWETWTETVEARSERAAINAALDGLEKADGEYVAVPARSWKPRRVQITSTLKFT